MRCVVGLLLLLHAWDVATPTAAGKVTLSFTGTVTLVVQAGGASAPAGVSRGDPVAGTLSYVPAVARGFDAGPAERGYAFPDDADHRITLKIGSQSWTVPLRVVSVCDDGCGGDHLGCSGTTLSPAAFPGLLDVGLAGVGYFDHARPYDLVDRTDLPRSAQDLDFGAATLKSASIASGSESGAWRVDMSLDASALPVQTTTWSMLKRLFSKP